MGADALPLPPAMSALQVGILQKRPAAALGSDSERTFKRGKSQSGDSYPAQLVQDNLLDQMMNDVTAKIAAAHKPTGKPRSTQGKSSSISVSCSADMPQHPMPVVLPCTSQMGRYRRRRTAQKGFASTVNSLQRAYSKMLHETFDNECSSDVSVSVRSLADAVTSKLQAHCPGDAEEGTLLMKKMLEHLKIEFKWDKIAGLLEAAAEEARRKKEECYWHAKACEEELREIHRHFD